MVVDKMIVDEMVVDKMVVDEMVVDETVVDKTVVDETASWQNGKLMKWQVDNMTWHSYFDEEKKFYNNENLSRTNVIVVGGLNDKTVSSSVEILDQVPFRPNKLGH